MAPTSDTNAADDVRKGGAGKLDPQAWAIRRGPAPGSTSGVPSNLVISGLAPACSLVGG